MSVCETPNFLYPMKADIYYPMITQNNYGQVNKDWVFDRTIILNATPFSSMRMDNLQPDMFLQLKDKLVCRAKSDIRISSASNTNALSNVLLTNIRDINDNIIYLETAGPRNGRGTIYEVALFDPFVNGFKKIEFYRFHLRRTENQAVAD